MAKTQLLIGLGHGGKQPGATAVVKGKTYLEKDLVRSMAPLLLDSLNGGGKFQAKTLNELCGKDNDATWPPIQQRTDVMEALKNADAGAIIILHFNSSTSSGAHGWNFCYNPKRKGDFEFAQKYSEGALLQGSLLSPIIDVKGDRRQLLQPRIDLALLKTEDLAQNISKATNIPASEIPRVAKAVMDSIASQQQKNWQFGLDFEVRNTLVERNAFQHYNKIAPLVRAMEKSALLSTGTGKPEMRLLLVEMGFLSNIGDLTVAVDRPSDLAAINFAAINRCFP